MKYPNLNKKIKLMEAKNEKQAKKPRTKKKINLDIDTDALDIKIDRTEGGTANIHIDTDIIDIDKTAEGTKIKIEKGGLVNLALKMLGLKK